jgi:hypothetical protein
VPKDDESFKSSLWQGFKLCQFSEEIVSKRISYLVMLSHPIWEKRPTPLSNKQVSGVNTERQQDFTFSSDEHKAGSQLIASETEVINSEVHATSSDPMTAESYAQVVRWFNAPLSMRMHDAVSTKLTNQLVQPQPSN